MKEKERPMKEFRAGCVVAAIWAETVQVNGKPTPQYSIRVQKRYRDDRDGQWKTTTYLRPDELPKLGLVVARAYEFLMLREVEEVAEPKAT